MSRQVSQHRGGRRPPRGARRWRPANRAVAPEPLEPRLALAAIAFHGTAYAQSFDALGPTGTAWANESTLEGWSLFDATGAAKTAVLVGDGAAGTGSFYNFGTTSSQDRSLGAVASGGTTFGSPAVGGVAGWMAVAFANATGVSQPSFVLRYDGEQWRNGGSGTTQKLTVEYGYGATFATVASWTPAGSSFEFTSPQTTATAAALDGNLPANRMAAIGGTVTPAGPWAAGTTLWIRWADVNDAGNDHGLGIDTVSFSLPTTLVTPPAAPTIAGITAADGRLTVAFVAPPADGGSPVIGYEYSLDDGGTWLPSAAAASPLVIDGLVNGVDYPVRLRALNAAGPGSASAAVVGRPAAVGHLRIVSYNITAGDRLPRAGLATLVGAMAAESISGHVDQVDLLAIQEVQSQGVTSAAVAAALNAVYGAGTYAHGTLNGATTGSGTQGVVYNTAALRLLDERAIGTASTTGGPRQTLRYAFQPVDGTASSVFYIYNSHFKSLDTAADAARRNAEATVIRSDADTLPDGTNILYVGDFNVYRSSEPAYQTLLSAGPGQAVDPIARPGDWHANSSFVDIFTQAPLATAPEGLTGGGLDDRFDFQIVSGEVMSPGGFTYMAGTYRAFGNNGSVPRNGSINDSRSTALPGLANRVEVLDLLTTFSDHLPVVADYAYEMATTPPSPTGDLFFSEYVEGSSNNKYLEIFNGGSVPASLSDYQVRLFANGSATATQTQTLGALPGGPATLAPGATLVLRNTSAALALPAGVSSFTSGVTAFSGDDALAIWRISTSAYVDIFGVIGSDPGSAWTDGSVTTLNATLRRKASVTAGVTANPATFATLASEWTAFGIDTVSGLGSHEAAPPLPASIAGLVWNDLDGDGTRDDTEAAVAGWTIFLDSDGNGIRGPGESHTVTGNDGRYAFTGLAAGTYRVTLEAQAGWQQTTPAVVGATSLVAVAAADGATRAIYAPTLRQHSPRSAPNDPLYASQWHLANTGQSGGLAGEDARLPAAWDLATGTGVVIGVVDDGLQGSHPDLAANYRADLSYDYNGNDADPSPGTGDDHGTAAAGVAAARGNNGIGVSGTAPAAGLAGIRLIAQTTTDQQEAQGLTHRLQDIDVYSNSWGPDDDGTTLEEPGPLTRAALATGATTGRGGLGSIYVWAAGNGLDADDNSNFDGYANSRYTIAVSAVDHAGRQAWYSEPGANILIAAPSSGGTALVDAGGIVTTDRTGTLGYNTVSTASGGDYATDFGGTSAATPAVAGVVALMLEANPGLGWRDVQQVLARSARRNDAGDAAWTRNGAGLWINDKYGFGVVDAAAAVTLARTWTNTAAEVSTSSGTIEVGGSIPDASPAGLTSSFVVGADITVETVEVTFSATHTSRGQLQVVLTSPAGTRSVLASRRPGDTGDHFAGWTFSTVRSLGESATGTWTLTVSDLASGTTGTFGSWALTVHGTPGSAYVPPPVPLLVTVAAGETASARNFGVRAVPPPGLVFDVAAGQTLVDATPRTGGDTIVKQGAGTLVLATTNTHTGGVDVQGGAVVIRDAAALGSGPVSVGVGTRLLLDAGTTGVTAASLAVEGLVDIGAGSLTVTAGLDVDAVLGLLVAGRGDGSWNGDAGIGSTAAGTASVGGSPRSVGWVDRGGGSFTFAFAAPGDTNLDAAVDILDAANVLAGGAYDTGRAAAWAEGDTTYDGIVDILDIADFLGTGLYDQPSYATSAPPTEAAAVRPRSLPASDAGPTLRPSDRDLAFAAFASDAAASSEPSLSARRRILRVR